jgi:hypothetical protein
MTAPANLSPSDIAAWFRKLSADHADKARDHRKQAEDDEKKSREYAASAARLETDFGLPSPDVRTEPDSDLANSIAAYLTEIGLAKRPADIAAKLEKPKEDVLAAIKAHPDRFEIASQGWVKLNLL